jgi:hypothetical protein
LPKDGLAERDAEDPSFEGTRRLVGGHRRQTEGKHRDTEGGLGRERCYDAGE